MPGHIITKQMLEVFKKDFFDLDTNNNGVLDRDEVRELAKRQLGRASTDEELASFMAQIDKDNDGQISFPEYLNCVLGDGWSIEGHDGEWWDAAGTSCVDGRGDVKTSIVHRRHNGKRQSATDPDQDIFLQPVETVVKDARLLAEPPTVERLGFALRHQPTGMSCEDFYDDDKVKTKYYKLCEEVIKQETGATGVKCFDHSVDQGSKKLEQVISVLITLTLSLSLTQ